MQGWGQALWHSYVYENFFCIVFKVHRKTFDLEDYGHSTPVDNP
ncbi:hypothetical protein Pan54_12250 [Rubinisphaera italica]|uniref:Uncharacterized protein n=1 Tax=Rubinisphaera italica TaxID=2527969 RepID=A0A5C5XDP5_9PLAN|nr:hypothetical protein Pan54_12250 [Rubinisphaera italica]